MPLTSTRCVHVHGIPHRRPRVGLLAGSFEHNPSSMPHPPTRRANDDPCKVRTFSLMRVCGFSRNYQMRSSPNLMSGQFFISEDFRCFGKVLDPGMTECKLTQ